METNLVNGRDLWYNGGFNGEKVRGIKKPEFPIRKFGRNVK